MLYFVFKNRKEKEFNKKGVVPSKLLQTNMGATSEKMN